MMQIQAVLSESILLTAFNRQLIWQLTKQEAQISNEILEQYALTSNQIRYNEIRHFLKF